MNADFGSRANAMNAMFIKVDSNFSVLVGPGEADEPPGGADVDPQPGAALEVLRQVLHPGSGSN